MNESRKKSSQADTRLRVWELANKHGVSSKNAIFRLRDLGLDIKNHMTALTGDDLSAADQALSMQPKEVPTETRPWDADSNPWSLDMLRLKKEHKGFYPKWVRKDKVEYYQQRGYVFADRNHYADVYDTLPGEESNDSTILSRRELVLMELPEHLYVKRQEYMRKKQALRSQTSRKPAIEQAQKLKDEGFDMSLVESN